MLCSINGSRGEIKAFSQRRSFNCYSSQAVSEFQVRKFFLRVSRCRYTDRKVSLWKVLRKRLISNKLIFSM